MPTIRQPAVAGMFYPSDEYKLEDELFRLLKSAEMDFKVDNVFGLISPHAGYIYSGLTAAYAFNLIRNQNFETVVILSPSHREYFPGVSIYSGNAYKTPIGEVPIDFEMREKLTSKNELIFKGTQGHKSEHAVEVQIPFLQAVLKDFSIVPVIIGDQRKLYIDALANELSKSVNDKTLIVTSTDLSHFHSKENADRLDSMIEKRIIDFDYDTLQSELDTQKCEACGGGGIVALLKTADFLGKRKSKILNRSDSGDVTGDDTEVVGYLSAVIYE